MLTVDDYTYLKTLYLQFRKCNTYIKKLMLSNDWDGVEAAVQEKDALLKKIIFFEKPRLTDIKENSELNKIRIELIELEKLNIELVKSMKQNLSKEIGQVHQANSLRNAYEPPSTEIISTVEVVDNE